jgi:hypothetical protein
MNCRVGGKTPVTITEVNMFPYADTSTDFYDVSMVDGANLSVAIAPNPYSFSMAQDSFIQPNKSCTIDDDCKLPGSDTKAWVCKSVNGENKCVNRFACGSPGCVSDCDALGLTLKSTWGGSDFAVPYESCKPELRLLMDSGKIVTNDTAANYKGCLSPTHVCADKTLNEKGYDKLLCGDKTLGFNFIDLYGCNKDVFATPYASGTTDHVCGCPGWSLGDQCVRTDSTWVQYALPYYTTFHTLSPASYSYAFDDTGATFQCKSKSKDVQVNYTITFCPK